MTLEDLWEVARKNLGEARWSVSAYCDRDGYSTAHVVVHHATVGRIERSIYLTAGPGVAHDRALELAALAVVEGRWTLHEPPAPEPGAAPVSPQEAA